MYGFKYVNGHPKNTKEGLQTVTAFGLLADVDTGYPKLLTEMTVLTALRTAATSAMVAKYLAFKAICGIDTVQLYDIDPATTDKAARNLVGHELNVVPCKSGQECMEGAQIITTCTADKQ